MNKPAAAACRPIVATLVKFDQSGKFCQDKMKFCQDEMNFCQDDMNLRLTGADIQEADASSMLVGLLDIDCHRFMHWRSGFAAKSADKPRDS